jgi:hypothetical protein
MAKDTRPQSSTGGSERLRTAFGQLVDAWAPAHPQSVRQLRDAARQGQLGVDEFMKIAQCDLPLLLHIVRQLGVAPDGSVTSFESFPDLLRAKQDDLLRLLSMVDERHLSNHNFHAMERVQAQSIKHGVVAATTARVLAERAGINLDAVTTCTSVRHFTLGLLAWNFPRVYGSALQGSSKGKDSLELSLGRLLGFNPRGLAGRLAESIGLPVTSQDLISRSAPTPLDQVNAASVLEASELFAALYTPELGQSARKRLRELNDHVDRVVGPNGFAQLIDECRGPLGFYSELDPHEFAVNEDSLGLGRGRVTGGHIGWNHLLQENTYAGKCPPNVQELLKAVYRYIKPHGISPEAVQLLASLAIPRAGFSSGCVFLANEATYALSPRLRIGHFPLTRYKINSADNALAASVLSESFLCSYPLRESGAYMFGEQVSYICAAFGKHQRTGVLYLELSEDRLKASDEETLLVFRALRHCLNDCLASNL